MDKDTPKIRRVKKVTDTKKSTKRTVKKPTLKKPASSTRSRRTSKPLTPKLKVVKPGLKPKKTTKKSIKTIDTSVTKSKKTGTSTKKKEETEVVLPKRMSIRAQEKALVLSEMFERDFYYTAVTLSRVAGLCFIVVGGLLSLLTLNTTTDLACGANCVAQAVAIDPVDLKEVQSKSTPEVILLGSLPAVITDTYSLPLEIINAADSKASLKFVNAAGDTKSVPADLQKISNGKFEIRIVPTSLDPNRYTLIIEALPLVGTEFKTFTVGTFFIQGSQTNIKDETTVTANSPTLDSTNVESKLELTTVTTKPSRTIENDTRSDDLLTITIASSSDKIGTESKPKLDTNDNVSTEVEPDPKFLVLAPTVASGVVSIGVTTTLSLDQIELFVRPTTGINTQSIGTLPASNLTLPFNSKTLPNGSYKLFAQSISNDQLVTSESSRLEIFNTIEVTTRDRESNQERELLQISVTPTNEQLIDTKSDISLNGSILSLADEKLQADESVLEELFTALSAAQQAGDETLIAAAEKSIQEYRNTVVKEALRDDNERFVADDLDFGLKQRLDELTKKVKQFEDLRRERTEQDSSIDSDQDGISDIDELLLYGTDPNNADTDGDGFTDGIEIMRGFDPLDPTPEAIVTFQSPKETLAVVKTDKLQIQQVEPNVKLATASTSEEVQTVVRGKALPNSFVTLYIFSTPTIVTVRTDETGFFEYTFTKELEDGEHQVFAALTDNTGEIIAQSEPFAFIKAARAFTPVDAQASASGNTDTTYYFDDNTGSMVPYQVVIGIAILALGIILLLLGLGLRSNKPDDIIVKES